jgi:hypothetical protein
MITLAMHPMGLPVRLMMKMTVHSAYIVILAAAIANLRLCPMTMEHHMMMIMMILVQAIPRLTHVRVIVILIIVVQVPATPTNAN